MGFFDKLFGGGDPEVKAKKQAEKEQRKLEEARQELEQAEHLLQTALGNNADGRSYSARSKAAISLVMSSHYDHGIKAWNAIATDFPDEAGDAIQQVGACYHLKKDYRSALEAYGRAIKAGYDHDLIADSIEEATKSLEGR
jgi:tetratricopeptide (TPR) repeat protein